jgi:hypothetical protein
VHITIIFTSFRSNGGSLCVRRRDAWPGPGNSPIGFAPNAPRTAVQRKTFLPIGEAGAQQRHSETAAYENEETAVERSVIGSFATRRDAETAVEHLVLERNRSGCCRVRARHPGAEHTTNRRLIESW